MEPIKKTVANARNSSTVTTLTSKSAVNKKRRRECGSAGGHVRRCSAVRTTPPARSRPESPGVLTSASLAGDACRRELPATPAASPTAAPGASVLRACGRGWVAGKARAATVARAETTPYLRRRRRCLRGWQRLFGSASRFTRVLGMSAGPPIGPSAGRTLEERVRRDGDAPAPRRPTPVAPPNRSRHTTPPIATPAQRPSEGRARAPAARAAPRQRHPP